MLAGGILHNVSLLPLITGRSFLMSYIEKYLLDDFKCARVNIHGLSSHNVVDGHQVMFIVINIPLIRTSIHGDDDVLLLSKYFLVN